MVKHKHYNKESDQMTAPKDISEVEMNIMFEEELMPELFPDGQMEGSPTLNKFFQFSSIGTRGIFGDNLINKTATIKFSKDGNTIIAEFSNSRDARPEQPTASNGDPLPLEVQEALEGIMSPNNVLESERRTQEAFLASLLESQPLSDTPDADSGSASPALEIDNLNEFFEQGISLDDYLAQAAAKKKIVAGTDIPENYYSFKFQLPIALFTQKTYENHARITKKVSHAIFTQAHQALVNKDVESDVRIFVTMGFTVATLLDQEELDTMTDDLNDLSEKLDTILNMEIVDPSYDRLVAEVPAAIEKAFA